MLPAGQNHPRNRMSHWRPLEFLVHKTQLNNKKVGSDWNYAMFMCQSIRASGYGFPLVDGKINAKLPTSEVHVLFIRAKFKWGHKLTTVDRRHQPWYLFFPSWNIRTEDTNLGTSSFLSEIFSHFMRALPETISSHCRTKYHPNIH